MWVAPAPRARGRGAWRDCGLGGGRAGAGSIAGPDSCSSRGSHWSHFGRYQFFSPSSFIDAGRSTARTIVASIRTAAARPMPISLKSTYGRTVKTANTPTMTKAALVTVPAVDLMPCAIALSVERPRS